MAVFQTINQLFEIMTHLFLPYLKTFTWFELIPLYFLLLLLLPLGAFWWSLWRFTVEGQLRNQNHTQASDTAEHLFSARQLRQRNRKYTWAFATSQTMKPKINLLATSPWWFSLWQFRPWNQKCTQAFATSLRWFSCCRPAGSGLTALFGYSTKPGNGFLILD